MFNQLDKRSTEFKFGPHPRNVKVVTGILMDARYSLIHGS